VNISCKYSRFCFPGQGLPSRAFLQKAAFVFSRVKSLYAFYGAGKIFFTDPGRERLVISKEDEIRLCSPHRSKIILCAAIEDCCGRICLSNGLTTCMLALIRGKTFHEFHRSFVSNHHKEFTVFPRPPEQESMPEMQVIERAKHEYSHRENNDTLQSSMLDLQMPVSDHTASTYSPCPPRKYSSSPSHTAATHPDPRRCL